MRKLFGRSNTAWWRLGLALPLLLGVLVGCGNKEEDATPTPLPVPTTAATPPPVAYREPPTTPGTPVANDGDVASGCWTEDQRLPAGTQPLQWSAPPQPVIDPVLQYTAVLDTNKGPITLQLMPDIAPITVNNFVCLARAGYYTNVPFHRIIDDFVIQGGDPTGTGTGGPGYQFADEPVQGEYLPGIVAMANSGPNTNGSQFFIVTADLRQTLGKQYNLFARVIDGQAAVDALAAVPKAVGPGGGQPSVPQEPVTLNSVTIYVH
jgi:cyclophilin family peptidyl-prolyl cis-trans isomerase